MPYFELRIDDTTLVGNAPHSSGESCTLLRHLKKFASIQRTFNSLRQVSGVSVFSEEVEYALNLTYSVAKDAESNILLLPISVVKILAELEIPDDDFFFDILKEEKYNKVYNEVLCIEEFESCIPFWLELKNQAGVQIGEGNG